MRIALVDSIKSSVYPLGLMKLGAWRRAEGDHCELIKSGMLPPEGGFDEIWITTTFTYDIPKAVGLIREAKRRADRVRVGGISASLMPERFRCLGVDVHVGLVEEAEEFNPDYSLLGCKPEYSISHMSRGCTRKCDFCMVNRIEPKFQNRPNWDGDIHSDTSSVLFYDNNWLAKKASSIDADIEKLKTMVAKGKIKNIDFNQALDARLMNERVALKLAGLPIKPVRFSFDSISEDGYVQDAVRIMSDVGYKEFTIFTLYNHQDTPADLYYRLKASVQISEELGVNCWSFPMRYQPIMSVDTRREYVGEYWTKKMKKGFMSILNKQSFMGQVSHQKMVDFEYWFGKDEDEFLKLLRYPKIEKYMKQKKAKARCT